MSALPIPPFVLIPLALLIVILIALLILGKVPLRYNVRNLVVRWPMSLLTGIAFTLVIALLTVMLAFVNGMSRLTQGSGYADNLVVLADGSNDENFSSLPFAETSDVDHQPGIVQWQPDGQSRPKALCSRELYVVANMPVPPERGEASGSQLRGKVRKLLIDQNSLIVADAEENDQTLRLAESAKVFANNQKGKLEALKPGDNVWVAYESRPNEKIATEIQGSSKRRFVQIRGIEDPAIAAQVHRLELVPGSQWFSSAGVEELPASQRGKASETAIQAVIGEGIAREMGPDLQKPRLDVGDVFDLGPKKWKVVGIMHSEGKTFDSEIWANRGYIGELFGKRGIISSMVIRATSAEEAPRLVDDLKNNYKKANLQPQTEIEYFSKLNGMTTQLRVGIIILTVFMAVGGIFGVMNTMFAAISQRVKDIGVLRILGYARWQILTSFLLESLVIALVGGLLGCALGSLCHGISATSIVGSGQGFGKTVIFRLTVDAGTIGTGVLLTLFMGLLGGLLPSLSAVRLRPLESMR
jgi:ABC-type lipoprotein release transport system permease subunit